MAQVSMTSKDDPRPRQLRILGESFDIVKKGKKGNWYFARPLRQDASGNPKVYADVTHLAVQPKKETIDKLNDKGFKTEEGKKLPAPDDDGKALEELIKLILRLKTGTDDSGLHYPRNSDFVNAGWFSKGEHIGKFLIIADWAGLWNVNENRMGKKAQEQQLFHAKTKSPKSVKLAGKKLAGFQNDKYINNWLEANTSEDTPDFHRAMANALEIMNITPSDLAMRTGSWQKLDYPDNAKKLKKMLLKLRHLVGKSK